MHILAVCTFVSPTLDSTEFLLVCQLIVVCYLQLLGDVAVSCECSEEDEAVLSNFEKRELELPQFMSSTQIPTSSS